MKRKPESFVCCISLTGRRQAHGKRWKRQRQRGKSASLQAALIWQIRLVSVMYTAIKGYVGFRVKDGKH